MNQAIREALEAAMGALVCRNYAAAERNVQQALAALPDVERLATATFLLREMISGDKRRGDAPCTAPKNGPGHGHWRPGIWDEDNREIANKSCWWCWVWWNAEEFVKSATLSPAEPAAPSEKPKCGCGDPECAGPSDAGHHQCGGPREACMVPGCRECGTPAPPPEAAAKVDHGWSRESLIESLGFYQRAMKRRDAELAKVREELTATKRALFQMQEAAKDLTAKLEATMICLECGGKDGEHRPGCDTPEIAGHRATDRDLLQRAAEALEWYLSREKPTNIRRDICELLDAIEARLKEKA